MSDAARELCTAHARAADARAAATWWEGNTGPWRVHLSGRVGSVVVAWHNRTLVSSVEPLPERRHGRGEKGTGPQQCRGSAGRQAGRQAGRHAGKGEVGRTGGALAVARVEHVVEAGCGIKGNARILGAIFLRGQCGARVEEEPHYGMQRAGEKSTGARMPVEKRTSESPAGEKTTESAVTLANWPCVTPEKVVKQGRWGHEGEGDAPTQRAAHRRLCIPGRALRFAAVQAARRTVGELRREGDDACGGAVAGATHAFPAYSGGAVLRAKQEAGADARVRGRGLHPAGAARWGRAE